MESANRKVATPRARKTDGIEFIQDSPLLKVAATGLIPYWASTRHCANAREKPSFVVGIFRGGFYRRRSELRLYCSMLAGTGASGLRGRGDYFVGITSFAMVASCMLEVPS